MRLKSQNHEISHQNYEIKNQNVSNNYNVMVRFGYFVNISFSLFVSLTWLKLISLKNVVFVVTMMVVADVLMTPADLMSYFTALTGAQISSYGSWAPSASIRKWCSWAFIGSTDWQTLLMCHCDDEQFTPLPPRAQSQG